ncbi:MAG: hypothetical protein KDD34_09655, partial [Bdellovibrionales bacterium]|nr:hypothetical protein [Bdellovibrionales bacterium]
MNLFKLLSFLLTLSFYGYFAQSAEILDPREMGCHLAQGFYQNNLTYLDLKNKRKDYEEQKSILKKAFEKVNANSIIDAGYSDWINRLGRLLVDVVDQQTPHLALTLANQKVFENQTNWMGAYLLYVNHQKEYTEYYTTGKINYQAAESFVNKKNLYIDIKNYWPTASPILE